MVPRKVLTRYGPISLNAARPINTVNDKNVNAARPNAVVNTARLKIVFSIVKGNKGNVVKASACWVWRPKHKVLDHGNPQQDLKDKGVIDSGCSRHITGNRSYLTYYKEIDGRFVAFGGGLTCLFAKATPYEYNLWHRRLGHVNFKTMNKLVKGKLVRGLPSKLFEINQTCVACQKGKQHRASYMTMGLNSRIGLLLGLKRLQGFLEVTTTQVLRIGINKWYQRFALRNIDLEDMEFESTNSNTTAKVPILKLENGNSWVFVPQTTQENGTSVTKMSIPVTAKEKTNKKNEVKARSLLLMALPNEHQLIFTTKKTQKTLLKQQYENFSASSIESLDSIFNRLQKIVSRLAILSMVISQEDLNSKFLSSLPPQWNTYVVVKKSIGASSGAQNLAFMTALSTSSTNHVNTAMPAYEVSTASPDVNNSSPQVSTASFNDNVVYAFMLSAKYEGKEIGHFARECRAPRSKECQFRNQDNTRKQGNNEDTSSKAMLAIDGVYNDKTCSKTCLKNYETLKKQCDDLIVKLNQTKFTAATYKRGLAIVEEQLITYRKNEFEKVKKEKEGIEFKIKKFDKALIDLDKLLESQITDKSKKGLGYSAVPPPHPLIYNRPKKLDLSYSGLDEFKKPEFKGYGSEVSKKELNVVCDKKSDDSKENSDNSLGMPQQDDTGFFNSGCSRHMIGNISYLSDFKEFDGGYVSLVN
ncbi:putative ribonuclease H-like domain-containing protein [Tanacetum coccineum]